MALKRRLGLLTAVLGITGTGLVFFGPKNLTVFGSKKAHAPLLSCQDVIKLGDWSLKHYGGPIKTDLRSEKFAQHASNVFLEKLDPLRMLFTAAEVKDFEKRTAKSWVDVIENRRCGYFDTWYRENYSIAKKRFWNHVAQLSLNETVKSRLPKKANTWAADETVLKNRLAAYSAHLLKDATGKILKAYQNDKLNFLKATLEDAVFPETMDPEQILAKSLLASIDTYSTYFSKEEFADFYSDLSGGTSGIGIQVRKVPAGLLIEKVLKGSAAAQSKQVKAGDIITAIDNIQTANLSYSQSKHLLKGEEETQIRLALARAEEKIEVTLTRMAFAFEEAKIAGRWVKPGKGTAVAVVSIPNFYGRGGMTGSEERSSSEDLKDTLDSLLKEKKDAPLVLDLRGNPGGYLEEAVAMAGMFVGDEPVVGVVEHETTRVMREEMPEKIDHTGPLVVLVDEQTASASEVLAGALKDHQRAIVVGSSRTYGKGSVQKLFHLDDPMLQVGLENATGNGVLKLTTSLFYSPLGHSPANGGVTPHIALSQAGDDVAPKSPVSIPEISPLMDEHTLAMIQSKQETFQERVAALEKRHQQREGSGTASTEKDEELAETVQIASDAETLQEISYK